MGRFTKNKPHYVQKYFGPIIINDWKKVTHQPNIIFISIASYRDNQCINTVQNIAEMADHPRKSTLCYMPTKLHSRKRLHQMVQEKKESSSLQSIRNKNRKTNLLGSKRTHLG